MGPVLGFVNFLNGLKNLGLKSLDLNCQASLTTSLFPMIEIDKRINSAEYQRTKNSP
jgi:hypothetical protein